METPGYTAITVERRGAADWVTLDRPERLNAVDHAMVADLLHYFGSVADDPALRVIVVRGAGRAFCAGVDIKETTIARHEDASLALTEQRRSLPSCCSPAASSTRRGRSASAWFPRWCRTRAWRPRARRSSTTC